MDNFTEFTQELYSWCCDVAQRAGRTIAFEVGTDEGSVGQQFFDADVMSRFIDDMKRFCDINQYPRPSFAVVPSHTRVVETRNIGELDNMIQRFGDIPHDSTFARMIDASHNHGMMLKIHNADYLSDATLAWFPQRGVDAINVAPEFGVLETRCLLSVFRDIARPDLENRFLELAYNSMKWEKWVLPETTATDRDRAVMAGHYIFATPEFFALKSDAIRACVARGFDLESFLVREIKNGILRYLRNLRLIPCVPAAVR